MKMKLLLFLGLLVGTLGLSVVFSGNAFAAGENYKWISGTTIEGSGGAYSNTIQKNIPSGSSTRAVPVQTVRFERVGTTNIFKAVAGNIFYTTGSNMTAGTMCNLQPSLTVDTTSTANATLKANEDGQTLCENSGLTKTAALTDTANAPDVASFTSTPADGEADATPSMCGVDGIGWIVCPIANSIADGVSAVFGMVKELLVFKAYSTSTTNGIYPAWAIMRNFANVAFVIAFMIIIYSQLTSMGISNYGIKKMLPRLIVAAILVNASYWICGIAVDVSNILGASLSSLFNSLIPAVKGDGIDVTWQDATLTILSGTAVGGIAASAALAAAGGFVALLWMLVPILISALFAILVAIIILAGRQVILIILIVISPLAFVAYLLPNTSKWYDKWQSTFFTLLLMYPMIAVIFGGSQLASAIILSADNLTMVMVMLALAVQVIPLAITPMLMKLSTGVLGRFAGVVNSPKHGPIDALKNRAKERGELATKRGLDPNSSGFINKMGQRRAFSRRREKLQGEVHESASDAGWAGKTVTDPALQSLIQQKQSNAIAQNVAGGVNQTRTTRALASGPGSINSALGNAAGDPEIQKAIEVAVDEATSKSIKEAQISAKAELAPGDMAAMGDAFAAAVKSGDSINAQALQNMLLTSGSAGIARYRDVMSKSDIEAKLATPNNGVSEDLRKNVLDNHGGIKASANDIIQQAVKGNTMREASADPSSWSMPDEELVHQKPASIELALKHVDQAQAARIIGNEELAKNLTAQLRAEFTAKAGITPSTQSPTSVTQQQSGTLNVQHPVVNANPVNVRTSTPPNTASYGPAPNSTSGLHVPASYQTPPQPPAGPTPPSNP